MSEALELEANNDNGISTLVVKGYINSIGGERIAEICDEHIEGGTHNFIFDLEGCRIVNSIGISILIEVIEKINELEGRVAFCCVSQTIAKTFRIMGLLQVSTVYDTYDDALQGMQG